MKSAAISIYMPAFNGGGAENAIVRLLNHWAETGQDVRLVVNQNTGPLKETLSKDVHVTVLGAKSTFANLPRLIGHLRRARPRVLMTALLSPNVAGVLAARLSGTGVPVVCLVRNHASQELLAMPRWRSMLLRPMLRAAYRRAQVIGCVATPVSGDLVTTFGLDPAKVHETFNPVLPPDPKATAVRPAYFPERGKVIVAIGRLVPQKDYPTVLRAFAAFRQANDAHLVILGDGPLRDALQSLATELGVADHVTMAGFVANPHAALAHADLFVLLSRFEGFPNVVGEALASGCRIVATDAPGGTADILNHGEFGHLVGVGDVAAAAAAFGAALSEPANKTRQIARAHDFSVAKIATRYIALCELAESGVRR